MKILMASLAPFIRLFRRHFWRMVLGTLLGWAAVSASVGLLALSGWFISAAAFAGLSAGTAYLFNFFYPSIGVRFFAAMRTLCRYAERIVTHDATFRMLASLRVWFFRKIEPLAPARLMRYRSADILSRIVADIDALDNLYVRALSPSIAAMLTIVTVVLFLAVFDVWVAGTALLFLLAAGLAVPVAAGKKGANLGSELTRQTATLRIRIVESIQGLSELLIFQAWDRQRHALEKESLALSHVQSRMSHIRGLSAAAITLLAGLATLACLAIGVALIEQQALDGAYLALIAFAVLASFEALSPLPIAYQYIGQTREAAQRLLELVDTPPNIIFKDVAGIDIERFQIEFETVSFCYDKAAPYTLEEIHLHIDEGQHVAILGETGAGKTTLFNLLVRFWDPVKGTIRIGNKDLRDLPESDLRQLFGVVSQQSHLFQTTLRENLMMAQPHADEAALRAALQKAQLLNWVETLPQGMDSWIGEGGRTVSGGQARRVILARLFLQDSPIWILDEPTEGLDRTTSQRMMQALFHAAQGRTLLVITHQATHLQQFDDIVFLAQGRIAGQGTHEYLIRTNKKYSALIDQQ